MYTYIHIHMYIYIYWSLYVTCYTLLYYRLHTMSQRRRSSSAEAQIPPQLAGYRYRPPQTSEGAVPTTACGLRESAASGLLRQRGAHRDCKLFGQSEKTEHSWDKKKSATAIAIVVITITDGVIHSVVIVIVIVILIFSTSSLSSHLTHIPSRMCQISRNICNYCPAPVFSATMPHKPFSLQANAYFSLRSTNQSITVLGPKYLT